jgi:hypothetical protein
MAQIQQGAGNAAPGRQALVIFVVAVVSNCFGSPEN